uniref:Amino acid transporter transmembrane domain-containing protein n=1 Tax=Amphimedon queenslandica TaxID=400682 RepID=A0A1X7TLD8_AMPQE
MATCLQRIFIAGLVIAASTQAAAASVTVSSAANTILEVNTNLSESKYSLFPTVAFCLFYGADGLLRERAYKFLGVFVAVVIVLLYITSNFIYHMVNIAQDNEEQFSHGELAARISRGYLVLY